MSELHTIDLNCDMGESYGAWTMGADAAVMPWVTSVNIACGFHAGDPVTMRRTVRAAVEADVAIGAHVALPDLQGFGRRAMAISAAEAYAMCVVQVGALQAVAHTCGASLAHMKPHGALYHMVEKEPALAKALVQAVRDVNDTLRIVGRSGGRLVQTARTMGLDAADEVFADRSYLDDGTLAPRGTAGAVIEDAAQAVQQALDMVLHGEVNTAGGQRLQLRADTLCIHGDRDDAEAFAKALHQGLRGANVTLHHPDHPR